MIELDYDFTGKQDYVVAGMKRSHESKQGLA
jgi:hypothetical protein